MRRNSTVQTAWSNSSSHHLSYSNPISSRERRWVGVTRNRRKALLSFSIRYLHMGKRPILQVGSRTPAAQPYSGTVFFRSISNKSRMSTYSLSMKRTHLLIRAAVVGLDDWNRLYRSLASNDAFSIIMVIQVERFCPSMFHVSIDPDDCYVNVGCLKFLTRVSVRVINFA